ncbi:uncharacterized protein BDR25DRAFT_354958 [Lindgomyces ingoldianus]|uniref:Uncharacterized protein n=1 Tax=Lindgomyces ingoldianus TaxID=673940 RepID=A0ACB6QXX8_9PLEO|nr:uncharacterized protein BDR25DRAFT_354958 [Lindgomyces ingoldianus]KAF2471051.1 hypothetical protein BDR25DRAFT_354958 [Lindgomyces ingoldianus]
MNIIVLKGGDAGAWWVVKERASFASVSELNIFVGLVMGYMKIVEVRKLLIKEYIGKERLLNKAHALNLVRQYNSIPVPEVLDYGGDDMGRTFVTMKLVTMKRIYGITLESIRKECQMPFITNYVLPQLRQLTSSVTGLEGFVLPPPRITKAVHRVAWQPIKDLARHNIIVSPKTREVTCIFNWEHAGYFPPELEVDAWRMKHSKYFQLFSGKKRI